MGSCFYLHLNRELDSQERRKLEQALQSIQQNGLGIRRHEGFGRVAINWQDEDIAMQGLTNVTKQRMDEKRKQQKQKPEDSPPPVAEQIFHHVLRNKYIEDARRAGIDKQMEFDHLPPDTQINR